MALQRHGTLNQPATALVYVAYVSDDVRESALKVVSALRSAGIAADYDILGRALRRQMDDASMKGAAFAVIIARDEITTGQVIIRSMKDGTESKHPTNDVAEALRKTLRA
jgi:histidyl-tRNA synthetase